MVLDPSAAVDPPRSSPNRTQTSRTAAAARAATQNRSVARNRPKLLYNALNEAQMGELLGWLEEQAA